MRETISMIRREGKYGEGFWTAKGLKQECHLSPIRFNMLMSELEKKMRKGK